MSWHRKVKSIYSISLVTISFIIWSTLSNWLFKSSVDYKLFLITMSIVFCTQYLNSKELKKVIIILVPLGVSIAASLVFFKGQNILTNTFFLLFMILITYALEDASVDYSQYKQDIIKSMVALGLIWIISFTLGTDFVNAMYRFHVLYIIMIIILMRETRRYVYDVKSNASMVTNIVIGISVLTLSLDYGREVIAKLIDMLMKLASYILFIITTVLVKIFGGVVGAISEKIRVLILKRKVVISPGNQPTGELTKQPILTEYKGIELPPVVLLIFKILILILILYIIYKFLSRFRTKTKKYDGFVEEKERIVRQKNKKHWVKDLFGKIFEGSKNNRERILYAYKGFEKITEDADIYKPYMTATQLKNVTKINVDNFDNLEEMTQVYNEAKFSMHDMTAEQVEQVKKGHSNIKKQL
jgi:hypothetical protein